MNLVNKQEKKNVLFVHFDQIKLCLRKNKKQNKIYMVM